MPEADLGQAVGVVRALATLDPAMLGLASNHVRAWFADPTLRASLGVHDWQGVEYFDARDVATLAGGDRRGCRNACLCSAGEPGPSGCRRGLPRRPVPRVGLGQAPGASSSTSPRRSDGASVPWARTASR